jgi:hypothetical protein
LKAESFISPTDLKEVFTRQNAKVEAVELAFETIITTLGIGAFPISATSRRKNSVDRLPASSRFFAIQVRVMLCYYYT